MRTRAREREGTKKRLRSSFFFCGSRGELACFKRDASFAPRQSSLLAPFPLSWARKCQNAPIRKERKSEQGSQGCQIDAFILYLLARRSRGDDARRKATLDIDDDDDDDKDGLVDGLEAILAPPRRASAEECMSRASDWKEWNVTTTRACLSRVHRREEERSTPFFSFSSFLWRSSEKRARGSGRESFFLPRTFFRRPSSFLFFMLRLARTAAAAGNSSRAISLFVSRGNTRIVAGSQQQQQQQRRGAAVMVAGEQRGARSRASIRERDRSEWPCDRTLICRPSLLRWLFPSPQSALDTSTDAESSVSEKENLRPTAERERDHRKKGTGFDSSLSSSFHHLLDLLRLQNNNDDDNNSNYRRPAGRPLRPCLLLSFHPQRRLGRGDAARRGNRRPLPLARGPGLERDRGLCREAKRAHRLGPGAVQDPR